MQQDCRHTVKDVNPTQIAAKLFGCLDKENMRIKKEFILRDVAGKKAIKNLLKKKFNFIITQNFLI